MRPCQFVMFAFLMVGVTSIFLENAFPYEEYREYTTVTHEDFPDPWATLEAEKPWLAWGLKFFNPPFLLKVLGPLGLGIMLLAGVGTFASAFAFEGISRGILIALALYCLGYLGSQFVVMSLVGQGVLSP